jgi:energy-coupling factor transport system ATP-binding protein
MTNAIRFNNVSYSYDGETLALNGLSFEVPKGSFCAIVGGNGSGKSTAARHMNALLIADSGTVETAGVEARITDDEEILFEIRSKAGMVFQNPDNQSVTSIVEDDVAFGPENLGFERTKIREAIDASLLNVGMQDFAAEEIDTLSGGQKQRVAIAGVLAMSPEIVIFDEPTAMLDPRGRRGVERVIRELRASGMTVVLITHKMEEIVEADIIYALKQGTIAMSGTPQELFSQPELMRELGLDVPFTIRIAESLRAKNIDMPFTLNEGEAVSALCKLYSTK